MMEKVRVGRGTGVEQRNWPFGRPLAHARGSACVLLLAAASCGGGDDFVASPGQDAGVGGAGGVTPEGGTGGVHEGGVGGAAGKGGAGGQGGGGGTGGAQDAGPDAPVIQTVHGKVVDPYLQPVLGVKVRIGDTETTTAADGTFELKTPSGAYAVKLVAQEGGKQYGFQFLGLTRLDPVLQFSSLPERVPNANTVSGTITWPAGALKDSVEFCDFQGAVPGAQDSVSTGLNNYNLAVKWYGASPLDCTLRSLTWTMLSVGGKPSSYTGYASSVVQLANGGAHTWNVTTSLSGVTDGSLTATIAAPDQTNYKVNAKAVFIRFGQGAVAPRLINDGSATWTDTYTVPKLSEATYSYCGSIRPTASFNPFSNFAVTCKTAIAEGETVTVEVPAPPKLTAPPNNQTGVNLATNFKWEPWTKAVYVMTIFAANTSISVMTSDTIATLPDLAAMGLPLPSQASFTYAVYAFGGYSSVDELTGATGFMERSRSYGDARSPASDGTVGLSEWQSITTQ